MGVQRQYTGTAGTDRKRPGGSVFGLRRADRARVDRPGAVPAEVAGPTTRSAAPRPRCPPTPSSPPNPRWPPGMITAPWMPASRRGGSAGDEVYGADPDAARHAAGPRARLRAGGRLQPHRHHHRRAPCRVDELAARCRGRAWQRVAPGPAPRASAGTPGRWSSIDRRRRRPAPSAGAPQRQHRRARLLPLLQPATGRPCRLVRVAGRRWKVEESFQTGKGLTGLDEHQVRRWTSWHRWVTLAMLAHAFLAVTTAAERAPQPAPAG